MIFISKYKNNFYFIYFYYETMSKVLFYLVQITNIFVILESFDIYIYI